MPGLPTDKKSLEIQAATRAALLTVIHVHNRRMNITLEEYYKEIKDCQKCPLAHYRTNLVFGVGSSQADLLFIGEAPGYHEDVQGEPFVGQAGKLLDQLLADIGLKRQDVYIANVLKCRPPENRDPMLDEIELCKPYLMKQIEIINPKLVVTLGNFSTKLILGKNIGITKVHGKKFPGDGYYILPTYHPAAALYNPGTLNSLKKDFLIIGETLNSALEAPPNDPQQMELF